MPWFPWLWIKALLLRLLRHDATYPDDLAKITSVYQLIWNVSQIQPGDKLKEEKRNKKCPNKVSTFHKLTEQLKCTFG